MQITTNDVVCIVILRQCFRKLFSKSKARIMDTSVQLKFIMWRQVAENYSFDVKIS